MTACVEVFIAQKDQVPQVLRVRGHGLLKIGDSTLVIAAGGYRSVLGRGFSRLFQTLQFPGREDYSDKETSAEYQRPGQQGRWFSHTICSDLGLMSIARKAACQTPPRPEESSPQRSP